MNHRTRTILQGIAALVALLAVIIAIPIGLYHFAGSPIPTGMPNVDQIRDNLSRPDDGTNLITALKIIGWLAWAAAAGCILYELAGQARHTRAPKIPIAGGMVAAVLALTAISGTTAATPAVALAGAGVDHDLHTRSGLAATAPAHPTRHVSRQAHPAHPGTAPTIKATATSRNGGGAASTTPASARPALHGPAHTEVTVAPGDTISHFADEEYGDPNLYPRIFEANKGRVQPDGRTLTNPNLVRPGWHLTIPAKATAAAETPSSPAPAVASPPNLDTPAPPPATASAPATLSPPAPAATATQTPAPASVTAPQTQASTGPASSSPQQTAGADTSAHSPTTVDETVTAPIDSGLLGGLGGLAAAGILGLLILRRTRQSSRRRPGQRIVLPAGELAIAEAHLRATADPLTAIHLDLALRTIAHHAAHQQRTLPPVRAARITPHTLELYLVNADDTLPEPFTADPEIPGAWAMPHIHLGDLLDPDDADTTPAPYPTLVTLGHDENDAYLLINLEEIGALTITGDPTITHAVLTALAVELIGSEWSDDVRVTLAGVLPELADALASDRVTYVDELGEILTALEYGASADRHVMAEADVQNPVQARVAHLSSEVWSPHLILTTQAADVTDRGRVDDLLHQVPRLAIATVTAGGPAIGEWALEVTTHAEEPIVRAVLQPYGVTLTPQLLGGPTYQHLLDVFRTNDLDPVRGPAWTDSISDELSLDEIPDVDPDDAAQALVVADYIPDTISALDAMDMAPVRDVIDRHSDVRADDDSLAGAAPEDLAPEPTGSPIARATQSLDPDDAPDAGSGAASGKQTMLRLLGNVEVLNPVGTAASPNVSTAILAYIALHPGAAALDLDEAIWPEKPTESGGAGEKAQSSTKGKAGEKTVKVRRAADRNPAVSRARNWFGTAPDGHTYLVKFEYRLTDDAPCDWYLFQKLVGSKISTASAQDLIAALHLVQGRPLTGSVRYATAVWVQAPQAEMIHAIGDVAHEIATRASREGDARTALWASGRGLTISPENEVLWRDALRAAAQTGDPDQVDETIQRLHSALDPLGTDLQEETEVLIHELRQRVTAAA